MTTAPSPAEGDGPDSGRGADEVGRDVPGRRCAEGRAPGTKGIEASADYIAGVFKKAGLKPAPGADGYFQPFTISAGPSSRRTSSWFSTVPTADDQASVRE